MRRSTIVATLLACAVAALGTGCGQGAGAAGSSGLRVVAAENTWGSLAAQLGGARVRVVSLVHDPAADPHDYEPTASDARQLASAQVAIVNGVGYDAWTSRLLDANPVRGREVLDVGQLVGVADGGNPHRWYSPSDVRRVIAAISAAYERVDPTHRALYERQRRRLEAHGLRAYDRRIADIRRRFAGVRVGASESIVAPLAPALGLRLITPPAFLRAVSEGAEPTAQDTTTVESQIARHDIRVWIFNSQNSTPDVQRLTAAARAAGIPVTTVTETLAPRSASFEQWQTRQLDALERALTRGQAR